MPHPPAPDSGYFRTPIATAMLCGVLAGAVMLVWWKLQTQIPIQHWNAVRFLNVFPNSVIFCLSAALAQRSWRIAWRGFGYAVLLSYYFQYPVHSCSASCHYVPA